MFVIGLFFQGCKMIGMKQLVFCVLLSGVVVLANPHSRLQHRQADAQADAQADGGDGYAFTHMYI